MRRVRLIEDMVQDVQYGLRTLRRNPGFAAFSILISAATQQSASSAYYASVASERNALCPCGTRHISSMPFVFFHRFSIHFRIPIDTNIPAELLSRRRAFIRPNAM